MPVSQKIIVAVAVAVLLSIVFWSGLWLGGGLIAGDLYSYFFPQKVFYAEQLAEGRIPVWNDRVGFGYPVLGESQTGALYPSNILLYQMFNVNTAYNVSQIAHYVLTFGAAAWFFSVRRLGFVAALFGAGVYTYAWFPPRICLEWAILGGPYLPLGLGLIERYLTTARHRYLAMLTLALALHLLAGHYNLAFIECVTWTLYAFAFSVRRNERGDNKTLDDGTRATSGAACYATKSQVLRWSPFVAVLVSIVAGFALASYPLADTYELKQQSQREGDTEVFTALKGHIPPAYLSQVVASWWYWYAPSLDTDAAIKRLTPAVPGDTNKVEAHLYFGLVPFVLAVWALIRVVRSDREPRDRTDVALAAIAVFAVIYATGVLVPVAQHVPGFGYFIGPGRWGIVATLVVSLFAARGLDRIIQKTTGPKMRLAVAAVVGLSLLDLGYVSQRITYAYVVPVAPINFIDQSPTKQFFDDEPRDAGIPRVYGPGANVLSMLGVAQWPTYLGLGPAIYWETMPNRPDGVAESEPIYSDEQRDWLARYAVSHVLTFEPIDHARWRLEPAATIVDPVLNAIWGRRPDETISIYRVPDALPAIRFEPPTDGTVKIVRYQPGEIIFEADASKPLESSDVVVDPMLATGWSEDGFHRLIQDGPLRLVDTHVEADAAGENVGAYWINYRPVGKRIPGLFVVLLLTLLGCLWLAYLYITRPQATPPERVENA